MSEAHFQLTDDKFEQQFQAGVLHPAMFTHEAHLRLAWIHIRKYGLHQAVENVTIQLQAFVQSVGAASKFNMTLTVAAVHAVNHFYEKYPVADFAEFIAAYPGLKYNFKGLINSHYKIDVFNTPVARQQYLEPDLQPFS